MEFVDVSGVVKFTVELFISVIVFLIQQLINYFFFNKKRDV